MKVQYKLNYIKNKGAIAAASGVLMLVFAISVPPIVFDLGTQRVAKTELKTAVDAAVLEGTTALLYEPNNVTTRTTNKFYDNPIQGVTNHNSTITIEEGIWDHTNQTFSTNLNGLEPTAIRVTATYTGDYLFAGIIGMPTFTVGAESISAIFPQDIVMTVDLSGSMRNDILWTNQEAPLSFSQAYSESLLWNTYTEIGTPVYGDMPPVGTLLDLTRLPVGWSPVPPECDEPAHLWPGIPPEFLPMIVYQLFVSTCLGLITEPYPYPSGSWNEYIDYMTRLDGLTNLPTLYSSNFSTAIADRYRYQYGYMTLMHYWHHLYYLYSQIPDLWKTSQQPLTALRTGIDAYVQQALPNHRLALVTFSGPASISYEGVLEQALTFDYDAISEILIGDVDDNDPGRQAGHYTGLTNIGGGLAAAIDELLNNGRTHASYEILLITDGVPSTPAYRTYALDMAQLAADNNITITVFGIGSLIDSDFNQSIAEISGGNYYELTFISGDDTINQYTADMIDILSNQIAFEHKAGLVH